MVFYREKDDPVLPEYSIIGVLFMRWIVSPISAGKCQQEPAIALPYPYCFAMLRM